MNWFDDLVILPLLPLWAIVATWWLPWERLYWHKIPAKVLRPYLAYAAAAAFYLLVLPGHILASEHPSITDRLTTFLGGMCFGLAGLFIASTVNPVSRIGMPSLKHSAECGNDESAFMLGALYAEGKGVPQDWQEAYFWYSLSLKNGPTEEVARKFGYSRRARTRKRAAIDEAAAYLTEVQISALDQRIQVWKPKDPDISWNA